MGNSIVTSFIIKISFSLFAAHNNKWNAYLVFFISIMKYSYKLQMFLTWKNINSKNIYELIKLVQKDVTEHIKSDKSWRKVFYDAS